MSSRMTILIGLSAWSIIASTAEIPASKLQGNFSVSPMGAATYSIPLSLPAGVNGATPKLSLEYNSQAGMGIAGMGWNIGGLSAITRCPQSKAVDGVQKALTFSPDDRFCMDGQRLILTSGTYGAAGSTYQTQINNFARVTALAHPNNTSLIYFKVDTKDGKVLEYGSRLDAVLQPNASGKANFPLVWMISRSEDRDQKGQLVEYDYTNDNVNGQQTLSRVRYAFDESDINNLVEVVFSYHTIPEIPTTEYPLPAIKRYIAGGATTKLNSQLAKITIRSASSSGQSLNEVINYQLRYEVASYTRRQRLKEIELCTSLANCMPPLKFQSSNPLNSIELAFSLPANKLNYFGQVAGGWTDNSSYPRQLVDVNGDGLPDIVGFASSGVMVALNNGQGGFNNAENKLAYFGINAGGWTDNSSYPRQLVDVNGDGLPDIVGFASSGVMVALNNGQGGFNNAENKLAYFGINAGGWTDNSSYPRQLVDVSGDGLPDIVGFASSGVMVALNNGQGGFNNAENKLAYFGITSTDWVNNNSYPRQLVDVNGDGLPDIVGFASSGVMVALNNGQGGFNNAENKLAYFGITSTDWVNNNSYPRQLVDVNGDGLPDIVGFASSGVMVALNNGQGGFNNAENKLAYFGINAGGWTDNSSYPRQLVDVNGDGLPDIVGFASSGVMVALNKATGFESSILVLSEFGINQGWTSDYSRSLIDLNGDGKIDILGFSAQGVIISNYKDGFQFDLITQFDKTALLGTPYNITYLPITNNQIYVGGGQSAYPNYNLRFPMYVVSSVSTSNGVNGDNHNDYFYRGLTANQTRGWQGFLGTAVVNREQKTRRETIYNQSFPYTGMVKEQRTVYCTANCLTSHTTYPFVNQTGFDVLSTLINTFEYTTINGISSSQKIYFPYVKSSTVKTYEAPIVSQ